jgi:shikimate dehydrogenase
LKRLAVLGHPVAHSRSPAMQSAALEALGLAGEWSYEAIDLAPEEFDERTRALGKEGFAGVNVTIPHKRAALELADAASAAASEIGAANTLTFADGRIAAENTDATGLLAAIGSSVSGRRALVLGAGGSARAAAWALAGEGAEVEIWNRTPERADELVRDLAAARAAGGHDSPQIAAVTFDQALTGGHDLFVNSTAVGLEGESDHFEVLPLDPERFRRKVVVVDLVYRPAQTELVRVARDRGARVIDGIDVLVRQGAESLRIWTGTDPPLEVMEAAARGNPEGGAK